MHSKWLRVLPVILTFGGVTTASAITNQSITPTTVLNYPGATSTQARGINDPGEIVGTFVCAAACTNPLTAEVSTAGTHGFLLQNGMYTRLDVPGGSQTIARGISSPGTVVGQYSASGVTHAFTYSILDGTFTYPIDVPTALFDNLGTPKHTLGVGINPQGELVGCYHEDGLVMTTMHGWLRGLDGEFHELVTPPHSPGDTTSHDPDTMNNGISATGEIVGIYFSSGVSYIADESGIVTLFTADGKFTHAYGVNARGDVVGFYGTNQAGTGNGVPTSPSGFLRTRQGGLRGFLVARASTTQIWGINDMGAIVGQYTDSTGTHGFVYRVSERRP